MVLLSVSAPHVVTARQAPSGEKWSQLSGEMPAAASRFLPVPLNGVALRSWKQLETEHTPEGSAVSGGPDEHRPHREMVMPAPCKARASGPGSLHVVE